MNEQQHQREIDRLKDLITRLLPDVYCDRHCACAALGGVCAVARVRQEAEDVLREGRILETCGP